MSSLVDVKERHISINKSQIMHMLQVYNLKKDKTFFFRNENVEDMEWRKWCVQMLMSGQAI